MKQTNDTTFKSWTLAQLEERARLNTIGGIAVSPALRDAIAFAKHQAADPHCTCNDCLVAHESSLTDDAPVVVVKPSQVEVDDAPFERSHGHAPRGRGCWMFCTVDPRRGDYLDHIISVTGVYSAARRQARIEAAARGLEMIYVCS